MNEHSDLAAAKILVVDDEEMLAWSIAKELKKHGAEVRACATASDALLAFKSQRPDLVISDLKLPDGDGLDLLNTWNKHDATVPFILMTAHGGMDSAIKAVQLRAFDYLQKPFQMPDLVAAAKRAAEVASLRRKIKSIEGRTKPKGKVSIVGESEQMHKLRNGLQRIADSRTDTVLINGETGTGKELASRAIHEWGANAKANFVEINCASIPPTLLESELFGHEKGAFTDAKQRKMGLFELAGNGTVFLDEIGEMPIELQPKLLRVLEQRSFRRVGGTKEIEFSGKVVAATNRDLRMEVKEKRFRADLYYRLNVIKIELPPLRERLDDISELAEFFLDRFSRFLSIEKPSISPSALAKLQDYNWPGNVREFSNVVQRAMVLAESPVLKPDDFLLDPIIIEDPVDYSNRPTLVGNHIEIPEQGISLEDLERDLLEQALKRTQHNQSKAAALLNISRHTMRYRLEKHGLL